MGEIKRSSISMLNRLLSFIFVLSMFALVLGVLGLSGCERDSSQKTNQDASIEKREEAYRANNLGVALLEQFKHDEGAKEFRRALEIDPQMKMARINLAIALFNARASFGEALKEAQTAVKIAPEHPQAHYILGLIARRENRTDDAVASFKKVLTLDPRDVGTNINLGQIHLERKNVEAAIPVFLLALEDEPYNSTAMYNLATAHLRKGEREKGKQLLERFQNLKKSGVSTSMGQNYLEQGRYAKAITSTGAESELVDMEVPKVSFSDATASVFGKEPEISKANQRSFFGHAFETRSLTESDKTEIAQSLSGGSVLFDYDNDGDLDFFETGGASPRLLRNDGGKFVDVSNASGDLVKAGKGIGIGVIAGDFDNDEKPDLFVLRFGKNSLYRNEGEGRFKDVTASAKMPDYPHLSVSASFVDIDHDGDLDVFIAGFADLNRSSMENGKLTFPQSFAGAPNMLLRNNGNGVFSDQTEAAKLRGTELNQTVAVVPFDFDNRRDVDLLTVNYSAQPALYRNLRDGTFRDVAAEVGFDKTASGSAVAAGDVNKDGVVDLFFGNGTLATSDGRGKYALSEAPAKENDYSAAQFLDYDKDGLLDLVTVAGSGMSVYRNLGKKWIDVTPQAVDKGLRKNNSGPEWSVRSVAAGDIDSDGDYDLLLSLPGISKFVRNDAGNDNRSVRVRLVGKVSNRSGIGAKIEMRAGSLIQQVETHSATPAVAPADVVLGLGRRISIDAVRVLWPAGIVQAETGTPPNKDATQNVTITELDRKPSSCPFLFTWNGDEFEFVTDFMGGGEMGYWVAPGIRNLPDPDEYVRIRSDQLKARDGRYEIRVTNELEEALFLDHLKLHVVSHPDGTEVYPNEGLGNPTSSVFKLYSTQNAQPPVAAFDDKGNDVLERIKEIDRRYPDSFELKRLRGYADEHTLTLELGKQTSKRTLLLLTGWTDYAFSSDNVAAAQNGMSLEPPALQVKDKGGVWRTVIKNIGIPIGRPQTVTVDLSDKFLSTNRDVRIVTNMRVYWDQILVDSSGGDFPVEINSLEPQVADLGWRGFSAESTPDGREPFGYDYARVSLTSPWKTMPGRYTREGDVRKLLEDIDDMFVVSRPGDRISILFDANELPRLRPGWKRTFLLYADGFSKEMDINSSNPDQVLPLPFHGMSGYPYPDTEKYPTTRAHRKYIEEYNTRVVASPMLPLEATLYELDNE